VRFRYWHLIWRFIFRFTFERGLKGISRACRRGCAKQLRCSDPTRPTTRREATVAMTRRRTIQYGDSDMLPMLNRGFEWQKEGAREREREREWEKVLVMERTEPLKRPHLRIIARWQAVKWIYLISDRYNRITRQLKVRWSLGGTVRTYIGWRKSGWRERRRATLFSNRLWNEYKMYEIPRVDRTKDRLTW